MLTEEKIAFRRASDVKPKTIEYLWYPYLPLGKLVMAEGDTDLGKSLTLTSISTILAMNNKLPDGTRLPGKVGSVYITAEEDAEDTVRPRFDKAGANEEALSRINIITYIEDNGYPRPIDITRQKDLQYIKDAIIDVGAKLVVLDAITSMVGDININDSPKVRQALAPLVKLANDLKVCIVLVRHARKGNEGGFKERGVGSKAFLELSRVGIAFKEEPGENHDTVRLFIHFKANNTKKNNPLRYRLLGEPYQAGYVEWLDYSDLTESEILEGEGNKGALWNALLSFINQVGNCNSLDLLAATFTMPEHGGYSRENIMVTLGRMVKAKVIGKSKRQEYCKNKTDAEWDEWQQKTKVS
jgi:hypothetical protein